MTKIVIKLTFEQALYYKNEAEKVEREAEAVLKSIPGIGSGAMGLTPDHVRATPEYKVAKANWEAAFAKLRNINGYMNKHFKKELAAIRKAKRGY